MLLVLVLVLVLVMALAGLDWLLLVRRTGERSLASEALPGLRASMSLEGLSRSRATD